MQELYQHQVQYYETDQMGFVHHSNYIRWFEEARVDFMRRYIVDYCQLEAAGYLIPVVGVQCHYAQPVRFGETAAIEVRVSGFGHVKFAMSYRVLVGGQVRASGETTHCFIDREGRLLALGKVDPELYAEIERRVQALEPEAGR